MKPAHLRCFFLLLAAPLIGQSNPATRVSQPPTAPQLSRMRNGAAVGNEPRISRARSQPAKLPQTGGVNFAAAVGYDSGGYGAGSVAVADVNGDDKPDLVVANRCADSANCNDATVGVLLGNGDGTFQTAVTYDAGGLNPGGNLFSIAVADVNGDGKPDIVVSLYRGSGGGGGVAVLLNKGDGTFLSAVTYSSGGLAAYFVAVADVNGDGKPDIAVANYCGATCGYGSVGVLLGNGDGSFQAAVAYSSDEPATQSVTVADVNGDGSPDLVVVSQGQQGVSVLLSNGDGTFKTAATYASGGEEPYLVAVADVNEDGKPDLLVTNLFSSNGNGTDGTVGVLLGNGDGTFQVAVPYDSGDFNLNSVAVEDLNNDGNPDIVVANEGSIGTLLGNGDGSFRSAQLYYATGGIGANSVVVADVNGDGKPDILVANGCANVYCVRGRGDGAVGVMINTSTNTTATALASAPNPSNFGQGVTFTAKVTAQTHFYKGTPSGTVTFLDVSTSTNLGTAPINNSGVATLQISTLGPSAHNITGTYNGDTNFGASTSPAVSQVVLGATARLSPASVAFGNQTVGTSSAAQKVTLTNGGDIPLTFNSITITGTNPASFTQTNNCGSSLAGGATCTISVKFDPKLMGALSAAVTISDNAFHPMQKVPVTGVGVVPAVTFSPTSLTFLTQVIDTTSEARTVTLTNSGAGVLGISKIAVKGEFSQTNNCGSTIAPAGSCTFTVKFRPTSLDTLTGSISVTDNAAASPQVLPLTGVGTAIQLTPIGVSFGNQPVGTKSLAKNVTVSNKSHQSVNISQIVIRGTDSSDFSIVSTTCGTSLASGASCFVKVEFVPTTTGKRTATVAISDDGGGEVQRAGLAGTGT